jgi:hypothetical protein
VDGVTVLQPTLYLENLAAPWAVPRIVDDGVLAYPLPDDVAFPWVATDDVAVAVERATTQEAPGWFALPGIAATGREIADAIGAVLGRAVRWQTIRPDEYGDMLRPHLGDHAADGVAAVYRNLAATPSVPAPDPALAREALDWVPRDAAAWARQAPAFTHVVVAGPCR